MLPPVDRTLLTMTDTIVAGIVQARVSGLQIPQNIATQIDSAK
jgi:hypothetical protein